MNIIMPQLGETVAEGTVTKWHKKVGDTIKADEALFDVETDKVSTEIPSPVAGVVSQLLIAEGATAKVGVTIAVVTEAGKAPAPLPGPAATAKAESATVARAAAPARDARTRVSAAERLSPVVRRLIAERNLDVSRIKGSGRDGRVTRDVRSDIGCGSVRNELVGNTTAAIAVSEFNTHESADEGIADRGRSYNTSGRIDRHRLILQQSHSSIVRQREGCGTDETTCVVDRLQTKWCARS